MRRRRLLDAEEERLWHEVARTVNRRARGSSALPAAPARDAAPPEPSGPAAPPARDVIAPFRIGDRAAAAGPSSPVPPAPPPPLAMDARTFSRMSRGKLAPEARIDLHGLTLAEAHPALVRFVLGAQGVGMRLILIITGKGRPAPDDDPLPRRIGLLRHQVPVWLRQPPLGPVVQQVTEAHLRHGGAGALYVYLRRIAG